MIIVLYCVTIDIYTASSLSMDVNNYPIAVYDMDKTEQSREIINRLQAPYFDIAYNIEEEDEINKLIEQGNVSVVVVFPQGFGRKVSSYQTASMQVIMDGSDSNAAELALGYISMIVSRHNMNIIFTKWKVSDVEEKIIPNLGCRLRYMYNPNLNESW